MSVFNNTNLRTAIISIKSKLDADNSFEKAEMRMAELLKKLENDQDDTIDAEDKASYKEMIDSIILKLRNKSDDALIEINNLKKFIESRIQL